MIASIVFRNANTNQDKVSQLVSGEALTRRIVSAHGSGKQQAAWVV